MIKTKNLMPKAVVALFAVAVAIPVFLGQITSAASLTNVEVRFDRMKISTATTGMICAKPATVATEATVVVTFPTGYTLGAAGTFTTNTTNTAWPATATAWPGIGTATNVTGQVVTFPSTDLTVGTLYCFNWANTAAVTVKATATASNGGTITTNATGPTLIDSSPFSTASIADDQIAVSASVPQAFSFALSANTDAIGVLSSGSIASSPTPRTITVNTNAANGWATWAKDSATGLNSVAAATTIASRTPGTNSTLTAGSEGYNTGITSTNGGGAGVITVAAPFVGGVSGKGGGLDTTFRSLATADGTATSHVLTLTNNVTVAGATPSGIDYADTITIVGAGLF